MKKYLGIFLLIFSSLFIYGQDGSLTDDELNREVQDFKKYRLEENKRFQDSAHSPLHKDSINEFHGLEFFPLNETFIVRAKYKMNKKRKKFKMVTSTSRLPHYRDYATLTFWVDGKTYVLHAYQNVEYAKKKDYENDLFIPFNDHTNGIATYGGGRYLDIIIPEGDAVILNFNMTYNPYCAYNDRYSCPIPPDENKLEIAIDAGVKKYH